MLAFQRRHPGLFMTLSPKVLSTKKSSFLAILYFCSRVGTTKQDPDALCNPELHPIPVVLFSISVMVHHPIIHCAGTVSHSGRNSLIRGCLGSERDKLARVSDEVGSTLKNESYAHIDPVRYR